MSTVREIVTKEVADAVWRITGIELQAEDVDYAYDDLADAAEELARAARRIAPEGHSITVDRS